MEHKIHQTLLCNYFKASLQWMKTNLLSLQPTQPIRAWFARFYQ